MALVFYSFVLIFVVLFNIIVIIESDDNEILLAPYPLNEGDGGIPEINKENCENCEFFEKFHGGNEIEESINDLITTNINQITSMDSSIVESQEPSQSPSPAQPCGVERILVSEELEPVAIEMTKIVYPQYASKSAATATGKQTTIPTEEELSELDKQPQQAPPTQSQSQSSLVYTVTGTGSAGNSSTSINVTGKGSISNTSSDIVYSWMDTLFRHLFNNGTYHPYEIHIDSIKLVQITGGDNQTNNIGI